MAQTIFLRNRTMGNIIEVPASDFNNDSKWGAAEKEPWEEVSSEEERNQEAWEQAIKDSKRHDAEVKKNEDLREEGAVTADAPPRKEFNDVEGVSDAASTAGKKGKS